MTSQRSFALTLAMTPGIGGRMTARVLARNNLLNRSPDEFFGLSTEALIEEYRLSGKAAHWLTTANDDLRQRTSELEARLLGLGVTWLTVVDAHYPSLVEEMDPNPPGVLFLYGNTALLRAKTFCVLSSRRTLPADLNIVESLTEEGVLKSEVLVAGHDTPEYQRSAIVPLRWGSPRILCLDRGLFKVLGDGLRDEAFRAARLWRYEFDPSTDLAVTPFRPEADFIGINNKVRDRLVASLSRRLDFVQAAQSGNMETLARLALKAGRPVRISDRSINHRALAAEGAEVISS